MSNLESLKALLNQKYDLVCFEDLADYRSQHRAIFDLFQKLHRTEYLDNQRFVFYTSHIVEPEFTNHIYRAAQKIDIGGFFILIVSPFDLPNSTGDIQHQKFPLSNTKKFDTLNIITNYNSFCVFPFLHLDVDYNINSIKPCCKYSTPINRNANNQALDRVFSIDLAPLREQFANGVQPVECQVCWDSEAKHSTSLRQHGLNKYGDKIDHGWFDDLQIRSVDLIPANTCNFNCRICNPKSSSKIAVEEMQHAKSKEQIEFFNRFTISSNKDFSNVLDQIKHVEYLHVLGGEPTKWKQFPEFLEKIIDSGYAKNIQIEINTNGSTPPEKFQDGFLKFKSSEILVSIDDMGKRFEIQRGGKWDNILKNLQSFQNIKSNNINVKIAPTVNIQNVFYLDQLVDFCDRLGFEIVWGYLETPDFLCINNMTQTAKELIYQKYATHSHPELKSIAYRVSQCSATDGKAFVNYIDKLDARRQQDFKSCHREIYEAMVNG
jgi:organic radical activating enzyme